MIKINIEIGGVQYCWPLDDVRKLYKDLKELFESKELTAAESVSRWPGWGDKWRHHIGRSGKASTVQQIVDSN